MHSVFQDLYKNVATKEIFFFFCPSEEPGPVVVTWGDAL